MSRGGNSKPMKLKSFLARKDLISEIVRRCSWTWNRRSRHSLVLKKSPALATPLERRIQEFLPAAANIVHRGAVASLPDELARGGKAMPSESTIEPTIQETARP